MAPIIEYNTALEAINGSKIEHERFSPIDVAALQKQRIRRSVFGDDFALFVLGDRERSTKSSPALRFLATPKGVDCRWEVWSPDGGPLENPEPPAPLHLCAQYVEKGEWHDEVVDYEATNQIILNERTYALTWNSFGVFWTFETMVYHITVEADIETRKCFLIWSESD